MVEAITAGERRAILGASGIVAVAGLLHSVGAGPVLIFIATAIALADGAALVGLYVLIATIFWWG